MSYNEGFGRHRPSSSTPPIGSPPTFGNGIGGVGGGGYMMDGVAQSYKSNSFLPPSITDETTQQHKQPATTDGPPLLKRYKVDFSPDEAITHLAAGLNQVVIATKDKKVVAVETTTSKLVDWDLNRHLGARLLQARIHKLFIDPTGKFHLVSLANAADNQPMENLLFVKRVQTLPRLKNHLISAVAWNHPKASAQSDVTNSNSTGTILLGTSKGLILQTELIHSDETKFFPLSPGPRQYVKEVFDVGPEVGAITGIEYHQIPNSSQNEKSFIIIVSTNNRLYRMVGSVPANVDPPPLHLIFAQNLNNYQDVPGRFNNARIDFYYPSLNSPPTKFAWLTEPGVMIGELHNSLSTCQSSFESNQDISIIPYNISKEKETMQLLSSSTPQGMSPPISSYLSYQKPIAIAVTNFHVIILFRVSIKAICILNDVTVYEEYFSSKYGNIQGMSKDPIKNIIWVYCERAVFRYKIINENRNIWKIYLEQEKFDLAKMYCTNDVSNYDRVICEEAQYYFKLKDYDKSAEIFAKSRKPFEEVALMFLDIKCSKALRKYLRIRLEIQDPKQVTQITLTLAWLLDIILSQISVLKNTQLMTEDHQNELEELDDELDQLLANTEVIDCLKQHSQLFYGITRNHSDSKTYVDLAKVVGDYEHMVQHYINLGQFKSALDVMKSVKKSEHFYSYGHILMKKMPSELVDALIEQPSIDPAKLIPVLLQENPYFNKCSETIRYLEFCVNELMTNSKVIHNYLFELYARHRDEETLIKYLQTDKDSNHLDLQLCLRLCSELKLTRTCVALYSQMELYDEALQLALTFDIDLAKTIAREVDSEDHQKRLWLTIAEHTLTQNLDIQIASGLLKECRLLKIEDILHFFPEYTSIYFFKDAIRQSLQESKDQVLDLKDGTYDTIADEIRSEIKTFRNRYSIMKASQRCEICGQNLLLSPFYLFPCGHLFHSDCIVREIISIDARNKERIDIARECVYCGSWLADQINEPPPLESDDESY